MKKCAAESYPELKCRGSRSNIIMFRKLLGGNIGNEEKGLYLAIISGIDPGENTRSRVRSSVYFFQKNGQIFNIFSFWDLKKFTKMFFFSQNFPWISQNIEDFRGKSRFETENNIFFACGALINRFHKDFGSKTIIFSRKSRPKRKYFHFLKTKK